MFTLKVGKAKPGVSQQVVLMQPAGFPCTWHPGIPGQGVSGFPHVTQAVWLQLGAGSSAATENTVLIDPGGKASAWPSATANGVWTHVSCPGPQWAGSAHTDSPPEQLQGPNRFCCALCWQRYGPFTASSRKVPGIPCPSRTRGSQTTLVGRVVVVTGPR